MVEASRSSWGICYERTSCRSYNKKANQLSCVVIERVTSLACLVLSLLLLTSFAIAAQTSDAGDHSIVYGLVVTAQSQPVDHATVEVWDLRGVKVAAGFTDSAGSFAITTMAEPGKYILLVAKELEIADEPITLDRLDRQVAVTLPVPSERAAAASQQTYTVSAQQLRAPAKVRAHLKLAQQEFSKLNFAGADREIDRALQVDSICAAAFSMRALLRLALKDPNAAIEDATRALALDSGEAEANVALATAYNSLGEFQKAETFAQQALRRRPDFWQGRLEIAKALYGEGRFVLALRESDELHNDFPDVHLVRANILQRLDRSQEAAEEFGRFLREAPNDPRSEQVKRIVGSLMARATMMRATMVPATALLSSQQ
jgi:tetratricopeptide (TPR) repeat protein